MVDIRPYDMSFQTDELSEILDTGINAIQRQIVNKTVGVVLNPGKQKSVRLLTEECAGKLLVYKEKRNNEAYDKALARLLEKLKLNDFGSKKDIYKYIFYAYLKQNSKKLEFFPVELQALIKKWWSRF